MTLHITHFKGYTIICENRLYYLAVENQKKYILIEDCFNRINHLIETLETN